LNESFFKPYFLILHINREYFGRNNMTISMSNNNYKIFENRKSTNGKSMSSSYRWSNGL